jgi:hypothetical protein
VTSFNLQVQFTGLCSFVPNDTFTNATKLMAVLPNADYLMQEGVPAPTALDGQPLARHRGFLKIPLSNLGTPTAPPDAVGIFYLAPGSQVTFDTDFGGPLQIVADPLNASPPNPASVMSLASMAELMPGGAIPSSIDPAAVSATPPANVVLAQVLVDGGFVSVTNLPTELWAFQPAPAPPSLANATAALATQLATNLVRLVSSGTQTAAAVQPAAPAAAAAAAPPARQIAHEVNVAYSGISRATVVIQNGGITQRINLQPNGSSLATVRVLNVCDDNQLEWTRVPNPQPDVDFKWFYQLLPVAAQTQLQASLTPAGLVVPVPVGAGAGGVDCSPGMFAPASF